MLAIADVVPYLLRRNLADAKSLCDCDLVVEGVSRRNRSYRIICSQGPCYLLKLGVNEETARTVAHEAKVYQLFQSDGVKEQIREYLVQFYDYDCNEQILILEFMRDAKDLRAYHARRARFSTWVARAMGRALGTLHQPTLATSAESQGMPRKLPWVLFLHQPNLSIIRDASSSNLELIKIIQQFAEFRELLNGLRERWTMDTLIHFDIKWDNCIVGLPPAAGSKYWLKFVDWEVAGLGDPCWDAGSVFMDYLSFWLLSIPITGETPPDRFPELARYPLDRMQPALRAFWLSYARTMHLDAAMAGEWLIRATKYAAARLVQTAYEQMQMSLQLTGNIICFLQLSLNILRRPEEAVTQLLGIPFHGNGSV